MRSILATAVSLALAGSATAGFTTAYATSNYDDWLSAGGLPGGSDPDGNLFTDPTTHTSLHTEDFSSLSTGLHPAGVSNGTPANWWSWNAASGAAGGGVNVVNNAGDTVIYSTPSRASLVFSFGGASSNDSVGGAPFASGLRGIGGGFRFFDEAGNAVNGRIVLTLSSGDALIRNFNSNDAFAGFWLTDPSVVITSLTLQPFGSSGGSAFVGATTLYLGYAGVPAPGSVALLGAAGLIGLRHRRA